MSKSQIHSGLLEPASSTSVVRVADQIYKRLRTAIMDGELPARVRLVEVELAARMNVSRTPVREAISRLISEQLVTPLPHGGVEVSDVTQELEDIFAIREALEGTAARLAAERMTDTEIELLQKIHDSHCALAIDAFEQRSEKNHEFHGAVLQGARAPRLARMVGDYREFFVQASQLSQYQKRHTSTALKQHQELIDALRNRDGKKAEKLTRIHLRHGMQRLLEQRHLKHRYPVSL